MMEVRHMVKSPRAFPPACRASKRHLERQNRAKHSAHAPVWLVALCVTMEKQKRGAHARAHTICTCAYKRSEKATLSESKRERGRSFF